MRSSRLTVLFTVLLMVSGCEDDPSDAESDGGVSRDTGPVDLEFDLQEEADSVVQDLPEEADGAEHDLQEEADGDPSCPPTVSEDVGVVSTYYLTLEAESLLNQELVVEGTLFTQPASFCYDLGPCGTCFVGLTLDGLLTLTGADEPGGTLCGDPLGCEERVDTCLPEWSCWPQPVGRRVRAQGVLRRRSENPPEQPWERYYEAYELAVSAISPADWQPDSGLLTGTAEVSSVVGDDCATFPEEAFNLDLVVVWTVEGVAVEFMSPGTMAQSVPIYGGWHTGTTSDSLVFTANHQFLGEFEFEWTTTGLVGTYRWSLSGPMCMVSTEITAEWVDAW